MLSGGGVTGGGAGAGSDGEPQGVAAEASPEAAPFGGGNGGVSLSDERGDLRGVVGGVLAGDGELRLAGATVLDKIVERLEISGGNLRDGSSGDVACVCWRRNRRRGR